MVGAKTGILPVALIALLTMAASCGDPKLTNAVAEQAIRSHAELPQQYEVQVDGISQASGSPEAIVRAKIADSVLNLKLRRFDTGWTWQSVETKMGTWIDASTALAELREQERHKKALEWSTQHLKGYAETAYAMNWYLNALPGGKNVGSTVSVRQGWLMSRNLSARFANVGNRTAQEAAEIVKRNTEPATDAWGSEILVAFDDSKVAATFVSLGPDKRQGTPDDLTVQAVGERQWSAIDEGFIWRYRRDWQLPEGLDDAIAKYKGSRGNVTYSRIN